MIKKEIKLFRMNISGYRDISASVPFSALSALNDAGIIPEPYFSTNAADLGSVVARGAELVAEFEVDAVMLAMDSMILCIGGVRAPLVVAVNGAPIRAIERSHLSYNIDIKRYAVHGKNTLSLRFAPREAADCYINDISVFAPIELVCYNRAVIDRVSVGQRRSADRMELSVEMTAKGYNARPRAVAVLVSPGGSVSYCTLTDGKGTMSVAAPNLWNPGKHRTHRLYKLTVNLYSDTELIDTREMHIGMRALTADASGAVYLSGRPYRPIALKYTSADLIAPRATENRIERMLSRAADTGADMLYIDASDVYPSERFLSLCDELGLALAIRVIKPLMSPVGVGESIARSELESSLRRFANHPSVFILCGAGEFAPMVREIIDASMVGVLYIEEPFAAPSCTPSLPTGYTQGKYFRKDELNLNSPALADRAPDAPAAIISAAVSGHRVPHSFGEWTYLSGVISAKEAVSALNEARLSSASGVCIADLGSPMPAPAPSVLDYSERPKAAYYYLSRCALPASVFAVANGAKISFYATNMQSNIYKSRLTYSIVANDNRIIVRDGVQFSVDPYSTSLVYEYDAESVVSGHESEYYLHYYATDENGTHSRSSLLFLPEARFDLAKPEITADITGAGSEYTVTLYSDTYARAVEVWFDGEEDAVLEDNFFDITSSMPVRIRLTTSRPTAVESLKRELRVRSMYDVGR